MRIWLALLAVAACSDSSSTSVDAASALDSGYDTARCLIEGTYGDVGALGGSASMGGITATLDAGPPRDTFFIKLVEGKGVFAGGVAPGTYTIAGADASYLDCGLCVHIIADIVTGQGPSKFYFADSGTVTLTQTAGSIVGSAGSLHLRAVDINSGSFMSDGCDATISAVTFSTP